MKTTTLRILFTLAILVGMAAAPDAQTFTWQAGRSYDAAERAERLAEQRLRNAERITEQAERAPSAAAQRRARRQLAHRTPSSARASSADSPARSMRRSAARFAATSDAAAIYNYSRSAENAGAERQVGSDADPCRDNNWGDRDYERHCEVRDSTMPAGPLNVDAGQNGGISIEGWDRNEIRVRAIVQASAREALGCAQPRRPGAGAGRRRPRVCDRP